jgi:hypothetical protein
LKLAGELAYADEFADRLADGHRVSHRWQQNLPDAHWVPNADLGIDIVLTMIGVSNSNS